MSIEVVNLFYIVNWKKEEVSNGYNFFFPRFIFERLVRETHDNCQVVGVNMAIESRLYSTMPDIIAHDQYGGRSSCRLLNLILVRWSRISSFIQGVVSRSLTGPFDGRGALPRERHLFRSCEKTAGASRSLIRNERRRLLRTAAGATATRIGRRIGVVCAVYAGLRLRCAGLATPLRKDKRGKKERNVNVFGTIYEYAICSTRRWIWRPR